MEIKLPADCGNAPRIGIVGDFVISWAKSDLDAVSGWLADEVTWTLVGGQTHIGPAAAGEAKLPFTPQKVEVISIITHGRLASCDGYLETPGRRVNFSHAIRFASTSKAAKITELRTYCIAQ